MGQKPLPATKDGYRYYWGEDDEPLCGRYIEEFNVIDANKRTQPPIFTKRKIISTKVKLSDNDKAPQLKLHEGFTKVTGEKGYSMVRATHGMNRGKYYYEVYIDSMPENTATRIGWGQHYANLQAPLGYDYFGYSYRSRFGTKFHQARGKTYDKSGGYREGDTIGCMIDLPYSNPKKQTQPNELPPSIKDTGLIVNLKKKDAPRVLEEQDKPPEIGKMKNCNGSKLSFYKNGRFIGVAYEDVFEGFYYPSISLYKNCTVSVNFGPKFRYPPEQYNAESEIHKDYQPVRDMAELSIIDNFLSDMLFVVSKENDTKDQNLIELLTGQPQSFAQN